MTAYTEQNAADYPWLGNAERIYHIDEGDYLGNYAVVGVCRCPDQGDDYARVNITTRLVDGAGAPVLVEGQPLTTPKFGVFCDLNNCTLADIQSSIDVAINGQIEVLTTRPATKAAFEALFPAE